MIVDDLFFVINTCNVVLPRRQCDWRGWSKAQAWTRYWWRREKGRWHRWSRQQWLEAASSLFFPWGNSDCCCGDVIATLRCQGSNNRARAKWFKAITSPCLRLPSRSSRCTATLVLSLHLSVLCALRTVLWLDRIIRQSDWGKDKTLIVAANPRHPSMLGKWISL